MPIHLFFPGATVEVWLDLEQDNTTRRSTFGLCIGTGASRAEAMRTALLTLTEAIKDICEEGIPTSDVVKL